MHLLRGRYRTVQPLGQGGFGRTYLALDEDRLNSRCVIKQFSPQVQGEQSLENAIRLFNQEAVRLHELGEHAQIPTLLAYFEQDGFLYLIQQFIEGHSLLQEMRQQGSFNERQIRNVLSELLPILRFIHRHQVIHRDITPNNVLRRPDGRLVLIDFGVAKQLADEPTIEAGTRVGTEGYAPMEQFRGGKAFPASDLYSLGATCLHLMTQTRPDTFYDPLSGRWTWREHLQQTGYMISDQLAHILDHLLKDWVGERYQSADEVMRDLNADSFLPATRSPNLPPISSSPKPLPPSGSPSCPPVRTSNPPSHPPIAPPSVPPPISRPPGTSGTPASGRALSRSLRCLHTLVGHRSWVTSVAVHPKEQLVVSSSLDDTIKLWNLQTGEERTTLIGHSKGVNTIAISPDGKRLLSGSDDYTLKVWNLHNGSLLGTLHGHARDVNAVAISPDGKLLVSGGEDRTIRLWSATTGALLKTLPGVGMIKAIAISRNGCILASGGLDNKIKLWSLQTGEQLRTLVGHTNSVNAIAFTPDGQWLLTGSKDKTVRLWNAQTGELFRTFSDHIREVSAVTVTPNGKTLISGSSDTTIKLWDMATGKVTYTWTDHADTVNAIALSPDSRLLVSGSSDKTIRIWQLPPV
ncbi:serine/threonine protein kinase [Thermocoleostomius sinensis A174]|uniref:Serine/threonine protein kinase n=2 Tax=Thermocoleostomius TaxID=3065395 RepID=A0A9E9C8R1_9CYAN|nr:serine/threonine-protein kinase [Thermocoleostomius sinensis]WAL58712.1 serine/threonine protein kinase [Thermocoleostomius sinensis A174]